MTGEVFMIHVNTHKSAYSLTQAHTDNIEFHDETIILPQGIKHGGVTMDRGRGGVSRTSLL